VLDGPEEVETVRDRIRAVGLRTEERDGGFIVRDPWEIAALFVAEAPAE
jgi:hypothetical protein